MSCDEHPDDSRLASELRDSLSDLAVPGRPPVATITSRGRVHQQRRRRLAGLAVTSAAACVALVLGLAGLSGSAPARGTGTIQTPDFTLTSFSNGTVSLRLSQLFDPAALQRALARRGVRALVRTDAYCASHPAAPGLFSRGVVAAPAATGAGHPAAPARGVQALMEGGNFPVKPSQLAPAVDPVSLVINPGAMPSGTELFIGFFNLAHTFFMDLISTGSHTCGPAQEPPGTPPPPATSRPGGRAGSQESGAWFSRS